MRLALAALVIAGATQTAAADPRIVSIGTDALDTARDVAAADGDTMQVMAADPEVAVISVPDRDLEALSEAMHDRFGRCGGFMVHDSLADALAVRPPPELDYSLDRGDDVRAVLPAIDPARILTTIRELSAMPNRYYDSATGAEASFWLRDRWRALTDRDDISIELVDHGWAQKSVILTIPGSDRADEVVVLGGHLDSISLGRSRGHAPGADDDASGIATLTEVARVLLANDFHPSRTVKLIAYAAEEIGLRGSEAIVRDFQRRGIRVIGALQLDMTNYQGSDKDIWLMKDFTSAAQNGFVIRLIETYVGATWGLDACGYACSDHASWQRAGVPASMPFESRMAHRNRTIHTPRDTLEVSGDNAAHAAKFARLAAAYAIELGKGRLGGGSPSRRDLRPLACLALALAALGLARRYS
jgi:leucyl aminopeptidase